MKCMKIKPTKCRKLFFQKATKSVQAADDRGNSREAIWHTTVIKWAFFNVLVAAFSCPNLTSSGVEPVSCPMFTVRSKWGSSFARTSRGHRRLNLCSNFY